MPTAPTPDRDESADVDITWMCHGCACTNLDNDQGCTCTCHPGRAW